METTATVAAWRIGESLAKARDLHRYKRGEDGFKAWCAARLPFSYPQAARVMQVHENLGGKNIQPDTLSREALFELAAPSTDDAVRDAIAARIAAEELRKASEIEAEVKRLPAEPELLTPTLPEPLAFASALRPRALRSYRCRYL